MTPPPPPRIDLRSDTFTLPTPAMREAMASAPLGDDVFGEDPTVNRLEALAAATLGKEAALFVTSGTQGNLVSLLAHCGRGDELIVGDSAHTYIFEQGGSAAVGGVHPRAVATQADGTLRLEDIRAAIRADNTHFPVSRLVWLENTHNRCSGAYLTPQYTASVAELAHVHGLKLHIDGARIFNAAVAQQVDVRELAGEADSVSFCLSKGLSAPVGSVVCGSESFIHQARRARKVLGGGMRQAGVVAAAGIVALTDMVERLADDHAHARLLAQGIAGLPGVELDLNRVQTNIVIFGFDHPTLKSTDLVAILREQGVGVLVIEHNRVRAVTHYGIEAGHIEDAVAVFRRVLAT